jgi:hypothetical protein
MSQKGGGGGGGGTGQWHPMTNGRVTGSKNS